MKKFQGTVKNNNGEHQVTVMARDTHHARTLLEQHGRLMFVPKMLAS